MALFEGYERRIDKINAVLAEYGIKSVEECKEITLAKGIDCDKIVRETQPICFENAVWAYTVGAAIAIKKTHSWITVKSCHFYLFLSNFNFICIINFQNVFCFFSIVRLDNASFFDRTWCMGKP